MINGKESVLGKSDIISVLVEEGFSEDEAPRAYELILDELERGLRAGRPLYFRRIFKVWPERMPPRRYWDNWNKKYIYFGERVMLKINPFFLKDRNMPTGRKIRAGKRPGPVKEIPERPKNNQPSLTGITRGQLGKADRALRKLGIPLPSLEQKEKLVRFFLDRSINPIAHTSSSLARQVRALTGPRSKIENEPVKDAPTHSPINNFPRKEAAKEWLLPSN